VRQGWSGRFGSRRDRGAGHGRITLEPRKANSYHFTGFGRTGDWFALKRCGVEPDILAFAKGITSGYLPLDGIMVSRPILDAMTSVPYGDRWIHAYTYSSHPTCCAVGLRNPEILEKEGLVENAGKIRVVRDILLLAPPLVIKESEVDRIVGIVREGIASVLPERV